MVVGVALGLCVGLGGVDAACVERAALRECAAPALVCGALCTAAGAEALRTCDAARELCEAAPDAGSRSGFVGPLAGAAVPPQAR